MPNTYVSHTNFPFGPLRGMVGLKSRGCRKLKKDEITKYEKRFEPKKKKLAIAQAIRQATPSIYVAHVSLYQYDDL